eukprot:3266814-Rhodomonas_salina.1
MVLRSAWYRRSVCCYGSFGTDAAYGTAARADDVVRPLYSRSHFDSWFAWCQQVPLSSHLIATAPYSIAAALSF